MTFSQLVAIVPHNEGDRIASILKAAGARGGTVLMARGTAENSFLRLLGVGDTAKDIVFSVVDSAQKQAMMDAVRAGTADQKAHYGILFAREVSTFFKNKHAVPAESAEETRMTEKTHKLITVILNKGFADDAMAAARKAGAGGGTVIHARGTAREEDASFFGITLVPEKEMLLILTEKQKADAVLEAVCTLPCLAEPGSGIAYCMDVDSFTSLGQKAAKE
ncbi:P-II family nitrogen regulator [Treponema brennaborense]|uniref:Nitrogen regulatory protein P-II n=1 Tax=Treponema brennaborense (strain DSM 12168 / CIP 105900 / DD5/3) TaxID=906968 RepID=F4LNG9_TREBD|nr:P-II family nitrogen regulator [Treponema brennaborense]AEE17927.1 hypothetical protein Trebr_2521 [Treponema brennaborense DSM 12168]